jgi:hypothetical protein
MFLWYPVMDLARAPRRAPLTARKKGSGYENDKKAEVEPSTPFPSQVIQIPVNLPLPSQLSMTGNLATYWKRFKRAWNNYEIAARLKDTSHPEANKELRTATLSTCIGSDALDVYDGFDFESPVQVK